MQLLDSWGEKPYKYLIEFHMRRQPLSMLKQEVLDTIRHLPKVLRPDVEKYVEAVNIRLAYDEDFWDFVTCLEAFVEIIGIALEIFQIDEWLRDVEDALKHENHELTFDLFQIPTLSITRLAETDRQQRKLMGIKKGLFG